jgi:hypothetical protein
MSTFIWCFTLDNGWGKCVPLNNLGAGININPLYPLIKSNFADIEEEAWHPSRSTFKFSDNENHIRWGDNTYGNIMFAELY